MKESEISWTDGTLNYWEGCTKVSPACDNCYAENRNIRFSKGANWGKGQPRKKSLSAILATAKFNRQALDGRFLILKSGKRVWSNELVIGKDDVLGAVPGRPIFFVSSLSDFFDDEVDDEWRSEALQAMIDAEALDFMVLTKRPGKIKDHLARAILTQNIRPTTRQALKAWLAGCPPPNIALGATLEGPRYIRRLYDLVAVPALRRFISAEPLLEIWPAKMFRDNDEAWEKIDLLIVGGESGVKARPMNPSWVKMIENWADHEGIPFHFKQWGEWVPADIVDLDWTKPCAGNVLAMEEFTDPTEPDRFVAFQPKRHKKGQMVHRAGKKAAGWMLQGKDGLLRERREILTFPRAYARTPWHHIDIAQAGGFPRNFPSFATAAQFCKANGWAIEDIREGLAR